MNEENNIHQLLNSITSGVNEDFEDCEIIQKVCKKYDKKPSDIILPLLGIILVISILTSALAHILITLFAMLYPSYMTFKVTSHIFRPSILKISSSVKNGWHIGLYSDLLQRLMGYYRLSCSFCLLFMLSNFYS